MLPLEKIGCNSGLVAKMGGWHTIDEIKTKYGEIPLELIINAIDNKIQSC